MASKDFSNASTGSKAAEPYTDKNADDNASVKEKVEDLSAFIDKTKFGMMTTRQDKTGLLVSRCMALAGKELGVDLIFHSNTESGKMDELHSDPKINISFINSSGEWASISGEATILVDRETVKKYYSPALKAWVGDLGDGIHDGGPNDPRIGVIKVNAITATYAISKRNMVGRSVEIAKGVVTGDTPDLHKLRGISEEEMAAYKKLSSASSKEL